MAALAARGDQAVAQPAAAVANGLEAAADASEDGQQADAHPAAQPGLGGQAGGDLDLYSGAPATQLPNLM